MDKITINNINTILKNSGLDEINESDKINESTDSGDILSYPNILRDLIIEKYYSSLLWEICDVFPLQSTLGRLYVSKRKFTTTEDSTDFEIIKKDIMPELHTYNTSFTPEVLQDIKSMYGKNAKDLVTRNIRGVSDFYENRHLIEFIEQNAIEKPELILGEPQDDVSFIMRRVGSAILEMNHYSYKTHKGWCILPWQYASIFFEYWRDLMMTDEKKKVNNHLYIGTFSNVDYYLDPRGKETEVNGEFDDSYNDDYTIGDLTTENTIYVGLKAPEEPGYGSIIFSPYQYEIKDVIDPDTGEHYVHVFSRYGLAMSPFNLPMERKNMIHKFKISRP
jgi:hypothetical protein